MTDIRNLESIFIVLMNLCGIWLVWQVFRANKKEWLNIWFICMSFSVIMWVDCVFLGNSTSDPFLATILYRVNYMFVALFSIFLYQFMMWFFGENGKHRVWDASVTWIGIIFALISVFTDWVVYEARIMEKGVDIVQKLPGDIFNLYALIVSTLIFVYAVAKMKNLSEERQARARYFLIGIFLFFVFNDYFNLYLPYVCNDYEYSRLGDYSALALFIFTAYPMTKDNLMKMKTFLAWAIIIFMSAVLSIDALYITEDGSIKIIKIVILVAFLYCGRELTRSMKKENEAMENIRKTNMMLAERNKDLNILLNTSNIVAQDLDLRRIAQDIVDIVPKKLKYLGYRAAIIFLWDAETDELYVYAISNSEIIHRLVRGAGISMKDFRETISGKDDLMIRSIRSKKTCVTGDVADIFKNFVDSEKLLMLKAVSRAKSVTSIPLMSSGQVMGSIVFSNDNDPQHITNRSKGIVHAFASYIGPLIENAKLYEKANEQNIELSRLNKDLKNTNRHLQELLEIKNDFLHVTSHQLRTPLTVIRGMVCMWLDGDFDNMSDKMRKEMLRRIFISTERLNNITNDMLDALELEGGLLRLEIKKVPVMDMVNEAITAVRSDFEKKNLYIRLKQDNDISDVDAEREYLTQAFVNILDNACIYTEKGGVEIGVKNVGRNVEITISDTGIGIDANEMEQLFQKFYRGERAKVINASESGLGLFIARKILDEHKGHIEVKSEGAGKGATIMVSLPKAA
jgi:signal transduction histidine kinase